MKQTKTFILLGVFLMLAIGMIGCSSGGSSSGGSSSPSTPATATNALVGTWKPDAGGASLTFNANSSGSMSDGHSMSGWTLDSSNVLKMNLNGTSEMFQMSWTNGDKTKMTLHNIGPNSGETTAYTKL
jgi:hypothetical protein